MEIINPGLGFIFWLSITFVILLFLLKKYAWKPITSAINTRNRAIDEAMSAAEAARAEMASLKSENEKILREAKLEKETIIKEAREMSAKIVAESKEKAQEEANKILQEAKKNILAERQIAMQDIKSEVAMYAVNIAEKILKKEMQQTTIQDKYLNDLVKDIDLN